MHIESEHMQHMKYRGTSMFSEYVCASDEEIQLIQIVRVNDSLLIVITGSAALTIICVMIIFEKRRRNK